MAAGDYVLGEQAMGIGFSKFEHATVGVLYLLFCILGVVTNFLTALTFYKDTKLLGVSKPWIHICLALANIGVVAPSPFPASSSFSGRWLYGKTMCQMYAFEGMFVGIVAIGSVIALCIERYYIANMHKSNSKGNAGWFYGWSIFLILGNGLFWAIMPLLGWSRYDIEHTGTSCAIDWRNPDESYISYMATLMVFSFVLPVIVALLCLQSSHSKESDQTASGSSESSQSQSSSQEQGQSLSQGQGQSSSQMTVEQRFGSITEDELRSLCYVFILLVLVGWGPFAFLCLATIFGDSTGLSMLAACIPPLACKLMVSIYPLVYAITSPRFRQSFKAVLGGVERKQD